MDLAEAMLEFRGRSARASNRQEAIQLYCCAELKKRGIGNAAIEVDMPGAYRVKRWDVGLIESGEPQLGISCKSIVSNHAGTVPNRVDDMLGEAANLHRSHPKTVLGYLFMMSRLDESKAIREQTEELGGLTEGRAAQLRANGDIWFQRLVDSVARAAGRESPHDWPEMFEAVSCSQVDFSVTPFSIVVHEGGMSPDDFFDRLVELHTRRFS
jgi:hypothetical protein